MPNLMLMDQTEFNQVNAYLNVIISDWVIGHYPTPIEIMRPDKPYCVIKNNADSLVERLGLDELLDAGLKTLIEGLEIVDYDGPLWVSPNDLLPLSFQLSGAPIDSFQFVLEGTSTAGGKYLTVATKMALPSNLTPLILPARVQLIAMTWINEKDGATDDLEIYINGSLTYTWALADCRKATLKADNEFSPILSLSEDDLVSVMIKNTGAIAAKDGYLMMFFRLIDSGTAGEKISPTL